MADNHMMKVTFLISLSGHLLLLGMPGFNSYAPRAQELEDITIRIEIEKPPLLPKIDVMGEEKKLKTEDGKRKTEDGKEQKYLPEPQPEPEPEPEHEPEPEPEHQDIIIPEPEPLPPTLVPRPEEIMIEELPEELGEENIKVVDPAREAMLRYQDMVKQRIESQRRYPSWAKKQGWEGGVYLTFVVISCGQARDVKIVQSSGFDILDKEAVSTIKRAGPFPPLPETILFKWVEMEVNLVFALN
ncbi:MAG: hypothetical protein DDT32_00634 [Syntrophomonadaceae bacterium]|nr:hypothetical protein [Bacillota bacterium]